MIKGLMLFHDHMEDVEALATKALLTRAGFKIDSVSVTNSKEIKMHYQTEVVADYFLEEIEVNDYSFLVLPGGKYVSLTIEKDKTIKELIKEFNKQNKDIFAICAAPMFLGELGLLKNKEYTIFPGCESESYQGLLKQDYKVVKSDKIITGRSVGAVFEFVSEIIDYYYGKEAKKDFLSNTYY